MACGARGQGFALQPEQGSPTTTKTLSLHQVAAPMAMNAPICRQGAGPATVMVDTGMSSDGNQCVGTISTGFLYHAGLMPFMIMACMMSICSAE